MTLQHDLDRLKTDLESRRKQLEEDMSERTLSRANTGDLAEKLRQLRDRIAITAGRTEAAAADASAPITMELESGRRASELE